jgi:hypothetical protein
MIEVRCYLPLKRKQGEVVGWTVLDRQDFEWAANHTWRLASRGYVRRDARASKARCVLLHREILGLRAQDGKQADHINGNRLDNRRVNLRPVTNAQNLQNLRTNTGASSRFRGVCRRPHGKPWEASATLNDKYCYIGTFASEVEAALAVHHWRLEHMPFAQPDPELSKALGELREAA